MRSHLTFIRINVFFLIYLLTDGSFNTTVQFQNDKMFAESVIYEYIVFSANIIPIYISVLSACHVLLFSLPYV